MIIISSCNSGNKENEAVEKAPGLVITEKGREIVSSAEKSIKGHLLKAIEEGGINNALEYCSKHAKEITDSVSDNSSARISRVSHRTRNSANQANAIELDLIGYYNDRLTRGENLGDTLMERKSQKIYYRPILVKNLCLNCHGVPGKDIPDETFISIDLLYPEDKAVGFRSGDLRGLWKVVFENNEEKNVN